MRTAIRERDLAVLAVHGRKERNPAAPITLLPVSSYNEQEVAATAAELQQRVRGAERHKLTLVLAVSAVHGLFDTCPVDNIPIAVLASCTLGSSCGTVPRSACTSP